jgi:hypothetical protein
VISLAFSWRVAYRAPRYFIVQNMYRGWGLFGIVLIGALIANLRAARRGFVTVGPCRAIKLDLMVAEISH